MSNPVFKNIMRNDETVSGVIESNEVMTINGTLQITAFMGLLLFAAAAYIWSRFSLGYNDQVMMLMSGGVIVGFISALIISFMRVILLIPVYAVCEGLALGGISAIMESSYPGIVAQAVTGTIAAFFAMLIMYRMRLIRCTDKFRSVVFISTASVCGIYIVNWIGSFFGFQIPAIFSSSPVGILFSLVVIAIASLNLIIDFDFVEMGSQRMFPKKYEWFGAFGLMVTIVWLYIEILNLLAKTRR